MRASNRVADCKPCAYISVPASNVATRQELYERARSIIVAELRRQNPRISALTITREQATLEAAVRRVETELAPAAPSRSTRRISDPSANAQPTLHCVFEIGDHFVARNFRQYGRQTDLRALCRSNIRAQSGNRRSSAQRRMNSVRRPTPRARERNRAGAIHLAHSGRCLSSNDRAPHQVR